MHAAARASLAVTALCVSLAMLQHVKDVAPALAPLELRMKESVAMGKIRQDGFTVTPRVVPKSAKEFERARRAYKQQVTHRCAAAQLPLLGLPRDALCICSVCCSSRWCARASWRSGARVGSARLQLRGEPRATLLMAWLGLPAADACTCCCDERALGVVSCAVQCGARENREGEGGACGGAGAGARREREAA
jgi:hypothetical protein